MGLKHSILGYLLTWEVYYNTRSQFSGTVSISVITKDYNLPSDFVYEQMVKRLGSIIEGFQDDADGKVIVTQTYVARNKAKIRAVLRAITVPTAVNVICNRFELEVAHRFRLICCSRQKPYHRPQFNFPLIIVPAQAIFSLMRRSYSWGLRFRGSEWWPRSLQGHLCSQRLCQSSERLGR